MCECCGPSEKEKQEWKKVMKETDKEIDIEEENKPLV